MTHQEAVDQMSVERYLLEELSGDARESFEEHMFDCAVCAADVKEGMLFLDAAKEEMRQQPMPVRTAHAAGSGMHAPKRWFDRIFGPWVLAPALAACLIVIAYQSAVVIPRAHSEVADARVPSVLSKLVLANAGARGDASAPTVTAPRNGAYLLSVDIPPLSGASAYHCTLYAESGAMVWQTNLTPAQARDEVTIQVPVMTTGEGLNVLVVQAVDPAHGDKPVDLARYRFNLRVEP